MKTPLPKAAAERLKLVDDLLDLRRKRKALSEEGNFLQMALGAEWRGERTPFAKIEEVNNWVMTVHAKLLLGFNLTLYLSLLPIKISKLSKSLRLTLMRRAQAIAASMCSYF